MSIAELNTAELNTDTPSTDDDGGVVLHRIPWSMYVKLRDMPENYGIRMTYDHGELEIMSPSRQHERIASILGAIIVVWSMEFRIPIQSCGKMTIRRKDIKRGFEPDNCYYIQNHVAVWNRDDELDFKVDPPPDLAIEVEQSRSAKPKMSIYQAFRVPELWRIVRQEIHIFELDAQGIYQPHPTSICFPGFPVVRVNDVLKQYSTVPETELLCSFRDWMCENCKPGSP